MATMTERDMLTLLRARYTQIRRGTTADRYVRAEHVRIPAECGYGVAERICDYAVIDTYGTGCLYGFEIKVSRQDWLRELNDPSKAHAMARLCDYFTLVISDPAIVRDGELPFGWGLMVVREGRLRLATRPSRLSRFQMTPKTLALFCRAIAKTAMREAQT